MDHWLDQPTDRSVDTGRTARTLSREISRGLPGLTARRTACNTKWTLRFESCPTFQTTPLGKLDTPEQYETHEIHEIHENLEKTKRLKRLYLITSGFNQDGSAIYTLVARMSRHTRSGHLGDHTVNSPRGRRSLRHKTKKNGKGCSTSFEAWPGEGISPMNGGPRLASAVIFLG